MELMSMLLLCAVSVHSLPLALGVYLESNLDEVPGKFNKTKLGLHSAAEKQDNSRDITISSKVNKMTDLQPFMSNSRCKFCSACVRKALDFHETFKGHPENLCPIVSDSQQSTVNNKKIKRNAISGINKTATVEYSKNKIVNVTKYKTEDDRVYAIKVNEINDQHFPSLKTNDGKSSCKVYSVKKTYPCESEESNLILMKRKVNKKRISKQKSTTTEKSIPPVTSAGFKKRKLRMESSHVPESFMPSIEELY